MNEQTPTGSGPQENKDAAIEEFRYATMKMLQRMEKHPALRDLNQQDVLQAKLFGALMGMIQSAFLEVRPSSRDLVVQYIVDHAAKAREKVDELIEEFEGLHGDAETDDEDESDTEGDVTRSARPPA